MFIFSIITLASIVNYVDPETTGLIGKVLFYVVLFFALSSLFDLILLWLRRKITTSENAFANVRLSFRQGSLLAIFIIGLLIMQSLRVLVWWDGLLLLVGIFITELYFLSRD